MSYSVASLLLPGANHTHTDKRGGEEEETDVHVAFITQPGTLEWIPLAPALYENNNILSTRRRYMYEFSLRDERRSCLVPQAPRFHVRNDITTALISIETGERRRIYKVAPDSHGGVDHGTHRTELDGSELDGSDVDENNEHTSVGDYEDEYTFFGNNIFRLDATIVVTDAAEAIDRDENRLRDPVDKNEPVSVGFVKLIEFELV